MINNQPSKLRNIFREHTVCVFKFSLDYDTIRFNKLHPESVGLILFTLARTKKKRNACRQIPKKKHNS